MFYTIEISKCVQKSLILITNDIFVLPSLLFTEQQQSSDTTFIFQMFVPPVFKVRLKFSVSLCLRRCDDWQWLKVAFVGPLLLFIMRGLWHPLHCLYVSYSLPRALCWSYLEPLLPKACGGRGEVGFELRCKFVLAVTFTTLLLPSACAPYCLNSNV